MVDVTNRANIHMRLIALEFTFGHFIFPRQQDRDWFECGAISDIGRKTQVRFAPAPARRPVQINALRLGRM